MQIRVTCPHCGKSFQIPERFAGRDGECSNCQQVFRIPEQAPRVSGSESQRRSGAAPTARSKPPGSSVSRETASRSSRPSAPDAGVTEEIPVDSVEPSDEFESAAASEGDSETNGLPNEPLFDITDADLLPDDDEPHDDELDDGRNVLERAIADDDEREDVASEETSSSGDIVLKRGGRSKDSQPRAGDSAENRSVGKPRRRKRATAGSASSTKMPADAEVETSPVSEAEGDSGATSDSPTAVPVLRRRRSGEERSRVESIPDNDFEDDFEPDVDEQSGRGSGRTTDRKRLLIFGGAGSVLLIFAAIYSQFSGPPPATTPIVVSGPATGPGDAGPTEQAQAGPTPVADSESPPRGSVGSTDSEGRAANGENDAPAKPPTSLAAAAPLPEFPALPEPRASAADGVSYYVIDLSSVAVNSETDGTASERPVPGARMQLILYLPPGEHPNGSLSCVLVAPAGTSLLEGADRFDDSYRDETLPYVKAGFAVVGYSLDGALEFEQPTDAELNAAYLQFRAAQAGLVNARNALEFVLARVPQVASDRIYAAGHSSAGTLSLLFAAHEPRLAGTIAYAPCTDPEQRLASFLNRPAMSRVMPGATEFARFESPLQKATRIKCPVFLFHAEDDSNVPVAESQTFADRLAEAGNKPTLKLIATGGHYDSMVNEGIPTAIEWLKQQTSAE